MSQRHGKLNGEYRAAEYENVTGCPHERIRTVLKHDGGKHCEIISRPNEKIRLETEQLPRACRPLGWRGQANWTASVSIDMNCEGDEPGSDRRQSRQDGQKE